MVLKELKKGQKFTIGKSKREYEFIWLYTMNTVECAMYWNDKDTRVVNRNLEIKVKLVK